MNVGPEIHYVAYLCGKKTNRRDEPHVAGSQLAAIVVPRPPTRAAEVNNQQLSSAIKAMQKKCAEHAGLA